MAFVFGSQIRGYKCFSGIKSYAIISRPNQTSKNTPFDAFYYKLLFEKKKEFFKISEKRIEFE